MQLNPCPAADLIASWGLKLLPDSGDAGGGCRFHCGGHNDDDALFFSFLD
jgi:hypothetical protein